MSTQNSCEVLRSIDLVAHDRQNWYNYETETTNDELAGFSQCLVTTSFGDQNFTFSKKNGPNFFHFM